MSDEPFGVPDALTAFRHRGYVWVWFAGTFNAFANIMTNITVGWLALDLTSSPFAVGVALASRAVPRLFVAAPIGALSDFYDRRRMLQAANLFGAALAVSAAVAGFGGWLTFPVLLAIAVLEGLFDVVETTVKKAYIFDVVGKVDVVNGMTWEEMGNKIAGVAGAFVAGITLARLGPGGPFAVMSAAFAVGALVLQWAPSTEVAERPAKHERGATARGLALLVRNRALLLIVIVTATAEILLFSSDVALPSFARDVLAADETQFGTMGSVRNMGGITGLLLLAALSRHVRPGSMLLGATGLFAVGLIAFSSSTSYGLSLALLLLVGVAWAAVDALQPALVQQRVADHERGAAIGVWNLSRGLAPIGDLEIGALAAALGPAAAQSINALAALSIVGAVVMLQRRQDWSLSR